MGLQGPWLLRGWCPSIGGSKRVRTSSGPQCRARNTSRLVPAVLTVLIVIVRNDHRRVLTTISVRQSTKKLLAYALHSTTFELDGDVVLRSRSLQRVERQVAPDALG